MEVVLGVIVGWALAASLIAAVRLLRPARVISSEGHAMAEALHAATVMLPDLRRGLSPETAQRSIPHLHTLTQAAAVALADGETLLAWYGDGAEHHGRGDPLSGLVPGHRHDRVHVTRIECSHQDCWLGPAIVAPLVVGGTCVGSLIALFGAGRRLAPEDTRTAQEAAALVSAEIELSELDAQGERLARAELRALRAQISPHFIYNALAAVAAYIHSRPEEARELLTDFAEFIRYAFRGERPYVTLADELRYVEKYLRLERARFGERLQVRLTVSPDVLPVVVPVLSVQPLVENAVRHGVERRGHGRIEIVGRNIGEDVELRVRDDGVGMSAESADASLAGAGAGIGLANVHGRLRTSFGPDYGLEIESQLGAGTTVTMTVPKFRAGVRAA
ncbi:MAG TPA: histidine kinase [Solirubrobacteraceae bacterium]|nr:histidine kinase [Solirubrobacteraceae bacterium]